MKLSPEEWDELPWYEQETYIAGFRTEGVLNRDDSDPVPVPAASEANVRPMSALPPVRQVSVAKVDW